jgi:protein-S-isoprenylcysteine O-methyltransferase Ste14
MNKLKKQAFTRFFLGLIFVWVLIFLPALSLYYWHGWVYWSILLVWFIFAVNYLLKKNPELLRRRLRRGPIAEKKKSQKIIQAFATFFSFAVFVLAGFDFRFNWSEVPGFVNITAFVLVVLSFWIVFLVFRENTYASSIIETEDEQKVISTGPYAVVRHPLYTGAVLLYFVTPIALGSYWGLIFSFAVFIMIIFRLLDEEKFLLSKLRDYKEYCEKVHYRLVPGLW